MHMLRSIDTGVWQAYWLTLRLCDSYAHMPLLLHCHRHDGCIQCGASTRMYIILNVVIVAYGVYAAVAYIQLVKLLLSHAVQVRSCILLT